MQDLHNWCSAADMAASAVINNRKWSYPSSLNKLILANCVYHANDAIKASIQNMIQLWSSSMILPFLVTNIASLLSVWTQLNSDWPLMLFGEVQRRCTFFPIFQNGLWNVEWNCLVLYSKFWGIVCNNYWVILFHSWNFKPNKRFILTDNIFLDIMTATV